jgi:hypothetical protein
MLLVTGLLPAVFFKFTLLVFVGSIIISELFYT